MAKKLIIIVVSTMMCLGILSGCNKKEIGLQVSLKENSEIFLAEEFSEDLFDVKIVYNDGSLSESLTEGYSLSKTKLEQLGTTSISIMYNDFSADVTVVVQERPTTPFRLNAVDNNGYHYYVGDEFDPDIKVDLLLKDGTESQLSEEQYVMTEFSSDTPGKVEVTISHQQLSTKLVYTIVDGNGHLMIDGTINTVYGIDQELDLSNVNVYYVNADGTNQLITEYQVNGFDTTTTGSRMVSLQFLECSLDFEIIIVDLHDDSVAIGNMVALGAESSIDLSWTTTNSQFVVEYEITVIGDHSKTIFVNYEEIKTTISDLTDNVKYEIQIRAKLVNGEFTDYYTITCAAGKAINLYILYATLPVLYAALEMYTNFAESYIFMSRTGTININHLPSHVNLLYWDETENQRILNNIKEIKRLNPDAYFNLYVDDLRVGLVLDLLYAAGIDAEKQNIYLLPDGTGSYWVPNTIDNDFWSNAESTWNGYVEEYKAGTTFKWGTNDPDALNIGRYGYYVATLPNVEYWIQYPEYIRSSASTLFNDDVSKMNFVKKNPYDVYNSMSDSNRTKFENMVLTGSDPSNNIDYFNSQFIDTEKIPVIITGTRFTGDDDVQLANNSYYINQVIADFPSEQYQLFFKPHPAQPPQGVFLKYLEDNGIIVLPYRTPMEIILWLYPEVLVGGYQSSLYLAPVKGNTKFFFGSITDQTLLLLKGEGYFDGAEYYV